MYKTSFLIANITNILWQKVFKSEFNSSKRIEMESGMTVWLLGKHGKFFKSLTFSFKN